MMKYLPEKPNSDRFLLSTYRYLPIDEPYFDMDGQKDGLIMQITYYLAEAEDGLGEGDSVNGCGDVASEEVDKRISEAGIINRVCDQCFIRWVAMVAAAWKEAGLLLQRALDIDFIRILSSLYY
jgi:hypothetical protein